jgi:hypothetical protein
LRDWDLTDSSLIEEYTQEELNSYAAAKALAFGKVTLDDDVRFGSYVSADGVNLGGSFAEENSWSFLKINTKE